MANEFVAKNGLISQNNSTVTGSLTVTSGITGSLYGTASWATNATTASYAQTASSVIGATPTEVGYLSGVTSAIQTQLNNKGYTLGLLMGQQGSFAANTTYYFGNMISVPATSAGTYRVYVPYAGTIKRTDIWWALSVGSGSLYATASIRVNNTTDALITASIMGASTGIFQNTSMNQSVTNTDYIEVKIQTPAWANAITNVRFGGNVYIIPS